MLSILGLEDAIENLDDLSYNKKLLLHGVCSFSPFFNQFGQEQAHRVFKDFGPTPCIFESRL